MQKLICFFVILSAVACDAKLGVRTSLTKNSEHSERSKNETPSTELDSVRSMLDANTFSGADTVLYTNPALTQSLSLSLRSDIDLTNVRITLSHSRDCSDVVAKDLPVENDKILVNLSGQSQDVWLCAEWKGSAGELKKLDPVLITIDTTPPDPPSVTGLPTAYSNKTDFSVSLSTPDVAHMRYALVTGSSTCSDSDLAAWVPFSKDLIVTDQGIKGERVFCIQGRDQAGNVSVIGKYTWKKMNYPNIKTATLRKAAANPVLSAGAPASSDDSRFLIGFNIGGAWTVSTFASSHTIYIIANCKGNDTSGGGWHGCVASCTTSLSCNWIDGNTGSAGVQALIQKFGTNTVDSSQLGDVKVQKLAIDENDKLMGVGMLRANVLYPVKANTFSAFSNMSYLLGNAISSLNVATSPDTWKGSFNFYKGGAYAENGTFYMFMTSTNAPTNNQDYLSVTTSTDMLSFTPGTNYVAKELSFPYVSKAGDAYVMVAFSRAKQRWVVLTSESLTAWDETKAVALELGSLAATDPTAWDYEGFAIFGTDQSQPEIDGAHLMSNKSLYLLYRAGYKDYTAATTPYGTRRSLGAFIIDWDFY